ncbi:MAG TPA: hypothetical protein EYP04_12605 [Anaerolineae bacterium]|nr:hypothetical protein [Anaerolineae bacterium]HIQ05740.1 hypothetical protein [Anaerolineae bacterium]
MPDSKQLPELRMVPTAALVLHEDCDPMRVDRLLQRLQEEGRLKNPPVVTVLDGTDRYIVLDGANRTLALRKLRVPHTVVQVVSYADPDLRLETWYHVVAGMSRQEFAEAVEAVPYLHLQPSTLEEARVALRIGDAVAYIIYEDSVFQVCHTHPGRPDIHLLNDLVAAYKGRASIYRASNDIFEIQAPYYPDITALVVFPRYTPADIIALVRAGDKVPSGITRHVIPNRALRVNIPLRVLAADWPLERKEAWLREWLLQKMADDAIRFYSEPTFLFDE